MPSIHHLNPPPHPFWDFVAGIEDHPFFGAYGRPPHYASRPQQAQEPQTEAEPQAEATAEQSEKAKGKQPSAEDPPEVDPSTVQPDQARGFPFRGRGRCGRGAAATSDDDKDKDKDKDKEGCRRGARGPGCRGRGGHHGPPPFMFGPGGPGHHGPWWARRGGPPGAHHGPPHHHHGPPGGFRQHSPPHHRGRPHPGQPGFDLGQFLNNLGERLGIDLSGAAESLGVDKFTAPRLNGDSDFEPRADIFDTATHYVIHLSLPGAKKEDVGVDWDGENSILRIAGVVHRPGVDEQMLTQLAVNGRKRENGVFEKAIRLGTKQDPANIDVAGITAKMTDGVLVVKVPKVEVEHKTREVPIAGSGSPSPARDAEKDLMFDADEEMYDAEPARATATSAAAEPAQAKAKEAEARDDRSETVGHEEHLPRYEVEEPTADDSDWEKAGSEDEGEYVKINVD